jgi:hypothetical protein
MAQSDHTRRAAFADLKTALADALTDGWTYDDRLDVKTAPQGRAHLYYTIGPWDTAVDAGRGRSGDRAYHDSRVVVYMAARVKPKDREARRLDLLDGIDAIELAAHGSHTDGLGLEVWMERSSERQSPSEEWWLVEVTLAVRHTFDLSA